MFLPSVKAVFKIKNYYDQVLYLLIEKMYESINIGINLAKERAKKILWNTKTLKMKSPANVAKQNI